MSHLLHTRIPRRMFYLFGVAAMLLVMGRPAQAQSYVEGISAILGTTSAAEIDTWSETFETPDLAQYYGAYVAGDLFQNGSLISSGAALESPYVNDAAGGLSAPVVLGSEYEIDSYHYLVAFYYYVDSWGITEYENPDRFLFADSNIPGPTGINFLPGGGPLVYQEQDIFLGVTGVAILAAPPLISGISPSSDFVGSSGQLTVSGENLIDIFTGETIPFITDPGVVLTSLGGTSTHVVLNYVIALNAPAGDQSVSLATRFGTSNSVTFRVGDRQPAISSVSPDVWNAGETTAITLTGTGFGTNPSLKITGPGVTTVAITSFSDNGKPDGATIHASVSVDVNSPGGTATLEVTSRGYNGNGFIARKPGDAPAAKNTAEIDPAAQPTPQIMFLNENISGRTKSPYAGQLIALTVKPPPSGFTLVSQSWDQLDTTLVIGNYQASDASGRVILFDSQALQGNAISFYATAPGSTIHVKYSYTVKDGNNNSLGPLSATATFQIAGPMGVDVNTKINKVEISNGLDLTGRPLMQVSLGNLPAGRPGITFSPVISTPPRDLGKYIWVQLLNPVVVKNRSTQGAETCIPDGFDSDPAPKLDDRYPYVIGDPNSLVPPPNGANDTPGAPLRNEIDFSEVAETTFIAEMYLLWTPPAATLCNGTTANPCSIPVPLGSVPWTWNGGAINQSAPPLPSQWALVCGSGKPTGGFKSAKSADDYPKWTGVVLSGTNPKAKNPKCTPQ